MRARVLVAGVGNLFLGDDGFGVEVAARLAREPLPQGVAVMDVGIRALHLAYALMAPPARLVIVDAVDRGEPPGTLSVIEPSLSFGPEAAADPHGMNVGSVFAALHNMGGTPPPTLIVGCQPAFVGERWGLSPEVEIAVPVAMGLVLRLARHTLATVEAAGASAAQEVVP